MITITLKIIIITFIITYIIGQSGIIFDLSKFIYKLTHKTEWNYQMLSKPWSCSVCMTFWIISSYCLVIGLGIIYSLGIGCLMAITSLLINKIIEQITTLINKI